MARSLFNDIPIREVLADRRRKLATAIAELSPGVFLTRDLDDLEAEFVEFYRMDPLVLNWDAMTAESHEVEIDVGGDLKVFGTEITHFVPFSGAPGFFDMRPSTHTENPPRGLVRGAELTISYSDVDADPSTFRSELARQESDVKMWVAWINTDVDPFNADLPGEVRAQLKTRFDKARADVNLVAALGVPQRQRPLRRRGDLEASGRRSTATAHHESVPGPRRGPGRPGWTRELFEDRYREALAATHPPQTYAALAEHFRAMNGFKGGLSGENLGKLRRRDLPE
jgi:hypothetical protein